MNFTKLFVGAFALSAMLVACDSDSASAKDTELEELSSSSVIASEATQSSSTIRNDSSSSSAMETSSSSAIESSSSSVVEIASSSVVEIASSSSTIRNDNSSSSSETTQSSSSSENISAGSVYDATAKTLKDLRDGKTYKTVTIGTQTWMAENLNYETGNSYCYDDDPSNCSKYGRLYTWAVAKTVCPEGWHLPSTTEWKMLFTAVGGSSTAGTVLKSQTGWTAYGGITNEDSFGFSALPAGSRDYYGDFNLEGYSAYFWSSTEDNSLYAYFMRLYYNYDYANLSNSYYKSYGFSVRCVKD